MINRSYLAIPVAVAVSLLIPELAMASVESTLAAIQTKFISTILPLCAILGLVFAAFSFFMGNPNARTHVFLAIVGAVIGFGAPSIVAFVRGLVQ
jgi:type IV secretory pathway VirB2 component (pilin)